MRRGSSWMSVAPDTAFASAVFAVLVSCQQPGGDAGVDAPMDAPAVDAGTDARRDAPVPDVPPDAGEATDWTRIGLSLPAFCNLERADHPERVPGVQLVWSPCAERDNCLRTQPLGGGDEAEWLSISDGYALGTWIDAEDRRYVGVVPLDGGAPILVLRSDPIWQMPGCTAWPGDLGEGRGAIAVAYHEHRMPGAIDGCAYFVASIEDLATISEPTVDDREHYDLDFPQELHVSATALIANVQPINLLFSVEDGLHIPLFVEDDFDASYGSVYVVGDQVFWTAWGEPPYIAVGDANTRGGRALHEQGPRRITAFWTDGREAVWLASLDTLGPGGEILSRDNELWEGTVSPTAMTDLRLVRRIEFFQGYDPLAGDGLWATATWLGAPETYRVNVVDLEDGRLREYETPGALGTAEGTMEVTRERVVYAQAGFLVQFDPRAVPYTME